MSLPLIPHTPEPKQTHDRLMCGTASSNNNNIEKDDDNGNDDMKVVYKYVVE